MEEVPAEGSAGGFVLAAQIGLDGLVVALRRALVSSFIPFLKAVMPLAQIVFIQIGNLAATPEDDEGRSKAR